MSNILTNLLKETSPSRLLRIVSTDFLALCLFCFNIRQDGRQILYFKLHVDGRKFHYRRPHGRRLCTVGLRQTKSGLMFSAMYGYAHTDNYPLKHA